MKSRVLLVGMDDVFYHKVRILLMDLASVTHIGDDGKFTPEEYDVFFTDTNSEYATDPRFITFGEGGDYPLPCRHETVIEALNAAKEEKRDKPLLTLSGRRAALGEREIMLTNKEAKLLGILLSGKEKGVTNSEICEALPEDFSDYNSLKVYVNYLRKKLESDGDKIIFTTRIPNGCKYIIHDKYWRIN